MNLNFTQLKMMDTFAEMLQTQSLREIQVRELCFRSSVNRSTFYRYFKDIDDLKTAFEAMMQDEIKQLNIDVYTDDWKCLFDLIQNNPTRWKAWFRLDLQFMPDVSACPGQEELAFRLAFFYGGLNTLCRMWLNAGCQPSPRRMADFLQQEYAGRLIVDGVDPFEGHRPENLPILLSAGKYG